MKQAFGVTFMTGCQENNLRDPSSDVYQMHIDANPKWRTAQCFQGFFFTLNICRAKPLRYQKTVKCFTYYFASS